MGENYRALFASILVATAALMSGCTLSDAGGHSAPGSVQFSVTNNLATEPPFKLVAQVHFSLGRTVVENTTFSNVSLCLYGSEGDLLQSQNVGSFRAPSTSVNISVRSEQMPYYVYVHHPRFDDIQGFLHSAVLIYDADREVAWSTGHPNEMPFDHEQMTDTDCEPAT